jgi:hypothetical protein
LIRRSRTISLPHVNRAHRAARTGFAGLWRSVNRVDLGSLALVLSLLGLGLCAVHGEWLTFPWSGSLTGRDLRFGFTRGQLVSAGHLYWGLLALAALLVMVNRSAALITVVASLVSLSWVPLHAAFFEPSWLSTYVRESHQRLQFAEYVANHFVPNPSPEPAFVPVTKFESLTDQLSIAGSMLGWGFYLACAVGVALLVWVLHAVRYGAWLAAFAFCLLSCMGPLSPLRGLLLAELAQQRGDRRLARGDGELALDDYAQALALNRALANARPFLTKVALAYQALAGGRHPLGALVHGLQAPPAGSAEATRGMRQLSLLETSRNHQAPRGDLERALLGALPELRAELSLGAGLGHARVGDFAEALANYDQLIGVQDLGTQFYLAHAHLALGNAHDAIQLLHPLTRQAVQPSAQADLQCTLGDAYTLARDLVRAREAYVACRELDKLDNYRASRALSGS